MMNNSTKLLVSGQQMKRLYEKQFEEVIAANEKQALARFADIRREKEIDQHNFLAGAIAMPLIGVMTAAATSLFKKKKDASKT